MPACKHPTSVPQSRHAPAPHRHKDRAATANIIAEFAQTSIEEVEYRTIKRFMGIPVPRHLGARTLKVRAQLKVRGSQKSDVRRIHEIQATPQPDHRPDHGSLVLPVPPARPPPRLLRGVFPEVDAVTQPVIIVRARIEGLPVNQGGCPRSCSAMVAD